MTKDKTETAPVGSLVAASPSATVELSETDLETVTGGDTKSTGGKTTGSGKGGSGQTEFLKITMTDVLISS